MTNSACVKYFQRVFGFKKTKNKYELRVKVIIDVYVFLFFLSNVLKASL